MRIIRFNDLANTLKVEPESFEDLYLLAIVIAKGDIVEGKSYRRFRPSEGDVGEQKEVFVRLTAETIEIDKNAGRLRISGKILDGKPLEFVSIGSYHTISLGARDTVTIQKEEWKSYVLKRIKQAVADAKKPKVGVVVLDDEKALLAYIRGYGIDIITELYSHLSKRMSMKDFERQKEQYFNEVIRAIENMKVDIVIVAGPGFTKDDIKKYIKSKNIEISKRLEYAPASDAERSGIREVMRSEAVVKVLESEQMKKEFAYLNDFLAGLRSGRSFSGPENTREAIDNGSVSVVLVNDSVLNDGKVKELLDYADKRGVRIEIFNSDDDAGMQLKNFKNVAGIA